jgi:iron complex transport system ATP-binding protein
VSVPLLALDRVCIERARQTLVADVSFTLDAGQVLAIMGANGAGKSTLLSAIAGEVMSAHGSVRLDGCALGECSPQALAELRAVNAVEPPLPFSLSVFDYVALGRPFVHANADDVHRALEECHALQWIARDAASLSSGELLRVQLARSLFQLGERKRCVWLLDEPFSHLDMAQRAFVLKLLRNVANQRNWTIIFSTHEPRDAHEIADFVLLLRHGRTHALGAPVETLTTSNLSDCFGLDIEENNISSRMP